MCLSSGKGNREKALGKHIVPTVDSKFTGHQVYRINGKIYYDPMGKTHFNMGMKNIGGKIMV